MKFFQIWKCVATATICLALVACGGEAKLVTPVSMPTLIPVSVPSASSPTKPMPSVASLKLTATNVASGLANPWGMAFLPDGQLLVTERSGNMRLVSLASGTVSAATSGLPAVNSAGQGGLLDVALDPTFASNQRIYFTFSENDATNPSLSGTAVARAELNLGSLSLSKLKIIFRQTPKVASSGHFGSRLVFDKNGYLWVTLGDRQSNDQRGYAQNLSRGNGKVVRITTDGAPAPSNPFATTTNAQPTIWSYGHRNPQGAAMHPSTGELWVNEHGPQGGDELNLALPGKNYGWPVISYGQEYGTTTQVGEGTAKPGMEQPVSVWLTRDGSAYSSGAKSSIAPSGMAFYQGDKLPEFQGNLFLGALAGQALWRVVLGGADGRQEIFRERLLAELGERIRDVRVGPDGWLYLLTDGGAGRVLRVTAVR